MMDFDRPDNRDIAALLGKQLWTTDSFVPRYRSGEVGSWRIHPGGQLVNDWGYYSGTCILEMLPSLARKVKLPDGMVGERWKTWMALTPHEIESQELGFRHAFKNVVIMGLGMGWIAANAALNPRVAKVTVVERDPEVIQLFHDSGALASFPLEAQHKVTTIQADALKWRPETSDTVDFLHADIWLHLAEPETLRQVRQMQANVQAETIYYWGQELAIHAAAQRYSPDSRPITADAIRRAVTEVIRLPLLIPDDRDYGEMIERVVQNRTVRGLTVQVDIG